MRIPDWIRDNGIYINGGIVIASGNMYDAVDGGDQTYAVFQFAQKQSGGQTYTLQTPTGRLWAPGRRQTTSPVWWCPPRT